MTSIGAEFQTRLNREKPPMARSAAVFSLLRHQSKERKAMIYQPPTRATPFGCVIGFFAIFPLVLTGFFWWGFFVARTIEDPERAKHLMKVFGILGPVSPVVGIALLVIGWKMAMGADHSSLSDPSKPKVRF